MYLLIVKMGQKVYLLPQFCKGLFYSAFTYKIPGLKAPVFMLGSKVALKGDLRSKAPGGCGYIAGVSLLFSFLLWSILFPQSILIGLTWWIFLTYIYISIHFGKSQSKPCNKSMMFRWSKTAKIAVQSQRCEEQAWSLCSYLLICGAVLFHSSAPNLVLNSYTTAIYLRGTGLQHKVNLPQMLPAQK